MRKNTIAFGRFARFELGTRRQSRSGAADIYTDSKLLSVASAASAAAPNIAAAEAFAAADFSDGNLWPDFASAGTGFTSAGPDFASAGPDFAPAGTEGASDNRDMN